MLIDSHAHIYDEEYNDEGGAQPIIAAMDKDNLEYIVCVGCDVPTSRTCVELAQANPRIYATVGVHPYDAHTVTPQNIDILCGLADCERWSLWAKSDWTFTVQTRTGKRKSRL